MITTFYQKNLSKKKILELSQKLDLLINKIYKKHNLNV
ncbi:MAG: aspartyl-phosphate phosphatase Spo0E family protein [Candidatus Woesearchaeota archaeon]